MSKVDLSLLGGGQLQEMFDMSFAKVMKNMLSNCKNLTFCENEVKILSAVSEENLSQITALSNELLK